MEVKVYEYPTQKPILRFADVEVRHTEKPKRVIACNIPLDKFNDLIGDIETLTQRILELDQNLFYNN